MKLSTRLSVFFLTALALVLLGFSTALFAMASRYLHRQVDERLDAALNTLAAAAEVTPAGVEWEPQRAHPVVRPPHPRRIIPLAGLRRAGTAARRLASRRV